MAMLHRARTYCDSQGCVLLSASDLKAGLCSVSFLIAQPTEARARDVLCDPWLALHLQLQSWGPSPLLQNDLRQAPQHKHCRVALAPALA